MIHLLTHETKKACLSTYVTTDSDRQPSGTASSEASIQWPGASFKHKVHDLLLWIWNLVSDSALWGRGIGEDQRTNDWFELNCQPFIGSWSLSKVGLLLQVGFYIWFANEWCILLRLGYGEVQLALSLC